MGVKVWPFVMFVIATSNCRPRFPSERELPLMAMRESKESEIVERIRPGNMERPLSSGG
jgi:hypothetical protein